MNYEKFIEAVKLEVETVVENDMRVDFHTTIKNNGKERKGIIIKDSNTNITPAIYLDDFYIMWQNGVTLLEIRNSIIQLYYKVRTKEFYDISFYNDYAKIKTKLAYKVINYEKNKALLQDIPYRKYLDLAIVFYLLIDSNIHGTSTILVTNHHISAWNISTDDLYTDALENTQLLLPATLQSINSVISELIDDPDLISHNSDDSMYVLSNKIRYLGASTILYKNELISIGLKLAENYYILPSSIHELIIIPESRTIIKEDLEQMVKEINETHLETEEVLSDTVYYYNINTQTLLY